MIDRRLLALAPEAMKHIVLTVVWLMAGLAANIALVYGIAALLAALIQGSAVPVQETLLLCAVAFVLKIVSAQLSSNERFRAARDVKRLLRERIYEKLLRLGPSYTRQVSTAEVVQVSVEGTEQLETYFGQYLPQLIYAVLAPVVLFFIIAPIHVPTAVVLLVFVPLIPAVIMLIQRVAKRLLGQYWDQYATLGDDFLENLQGLTTLKIYQADEARHDLMNRTAERFRIITMKVLRMQLNSIIVMDVVALGGAAAGISVALFALSEGVITLESFLIIVLLSSDFFLPMRLLGSFFHVAMNGMAASKKIFRILDLEEPTGKTRTAEAGGTLRMDNVEFGYEEGRTVLHGVTLDVPARGLTAIVGGSGCGKSTIALLLAGRDDSYRGSVTFGDAEVRDIAPESLADTVTSVGIGSYLFRGTVRDNLAFANPKATDEDMWAALESAALADFMREQDGLDTELESEASNLSGGQRQRLALARALLHDTPVYVFDEATSNIDVESEEAIMSVVDRLARDHAVVIISHRLANVVGADLIYALDAGRIAGAGVHDELVASCASYRTLWESQQELESYRGGAVHGTRE